MRERTVSVLVLALLFTGILLLAFRIQPAEAAVSPFSPADAISIMPSTATVPVNQLITVTITITNITDCSSYRLWIDYNPSALEYVGYNFDTDPANPMSPTQMAPAPANRGDTDGSVPGSVKLLTTYFVWYGIPPYSYEGDSVAAEITFKGKKAGHSALNFDTDWTRAHDYNGDDILFSELNNGAITVVQTHPLTVYSSPTGATFTVDGVPHATPWSETYIEGSSVNLEMPATHGGYFWDHWSDTDTNRIRTVTIDTNITLTAVYASIPSPVGGKATPIVISVNKLSPLAPYIGLTILLTVAVATVVYAKIRRKQ